MRESQEVSAEQRIKALTVFEEEKRKELEDKKAELEAKKKELEKLEKEGEEEIEDAREELQSKIEEIILKQRRLLLEEEEKKKKRQQKEHEKDATKKSKELETENEKKEKTLEQTVSQEPARDLPDQNVKGYADAISHIMNGSPSFYDMTDYNVINKLEYLATTSEQRPLSRSESEFINLAEYHAKELSKEYRDKPGADYLTQGLEKINFINKQKKKDQESNYLI